MSILNEVEFAYEALDTGARNPTHAIQARQGGQRLGDLTWGPKGIKYVGVEPEYRRQGVATKMWEHAHTLAAENRRIPAPKHSSDRTKDGDAWAKSVGGPLPRKK